MKCLYPFILLCFLLSCSERISGKYFAQSLTEQEKKSLIRKSLTLRADGILVYVISGDSGPLGIYKGFWKKSGSKISIEGPSIDFDKQHNNKSQVLGVKKMHIDGLNKSKKAVTISNVYENDTTALIGAVISSISGDFIMDQSPVLLNSSDPLISIKYSISESVNYKFDDDDNNNYYQIFLYLYFGHNYEKLDSLPFKTLTYKRNQLLADHSAIFTKE